MDEQWDVISQRILRAVKRMCQIDGCTSHNVYLAQPQIGWCTTCNHERGRIADKNFLSILVSPGQVMPPDEVFSRRVPLGWRRFCANAYSYLSGINGNILLFKGVVAQERSCLNCLL
ncbi:MAG: hypothetical protein KME45_04490 [Stenomitos rutilans HA7619-LM2]|nr:hypothetical protein [Stenomitos rutilans HA7619-LM2]